MSYSVIATSPFERQLKKLAKKYKSFKEDIAPIIEDLHHNPEIGSPLEKNCFKIRVAISSKTQINLVLHGS